MAATWALGSASASGLMSGPVRETEREPALGSESAAAMVPGWDPARGLTSAERSADRLVLERASAWGAAWEAVTAAATVLGWEAATAAA